MPAVFSLVVGLGNPGTKYVGTRHNVGFDVVDELANRWKVTFSKKFQGLFGERLDSGEKVRLLKPQTFMNLSGDCVREAATYYKISPEAILVVADDLDLPAGRLRIRKFGGSGGHNGLKSVIEGLGGESFPRVRIGIGRGSTASDHVLGKIPKSEWEDHRITVGEAADAVEMILNEGIEKAMNRFNQKKDDDES